MLAYPEGLPAPLRDGYGFEAVSPLVVTPLSTGRVRQRRRFASVPTVASVGWILSAPQAALFQAWFEEVLNAGSEWFECPLRTPLGMDNHRAQFVDIYKGPDLVGVDHWRITAELRLFKVPMFEPGWAGVIPDFILQADIFDRAVNQKWPKP